MNDAGRSLFNLRKNKEARPIRSILEPYLIDLVHYLLRHVQAILLISIALVALFVFFLPRFQFVIDDRGIYPNSSDPERQFFEKTEETFGRMDKIIVGILAKDIFRRSTLQKIKRITERIENITGVESAFSITNAQYFDHEGEALRVRDVLQDTPEGIEGTEILRERVHSNRLLKGRLISDNGTLASILISLKPGLSSKEIIKTVRQIKSVAHSEEGPESILLSGPSIASCEMEISALKDVQRLFPLIMGLSLVILFMNFKNVKVVFFSWLAIIFGVSATFGILGLIGIPMTILLGMLPAILMVTGTSYTLYLLAEHNTLQKQFPNDQEKEILQETLRQVSPAVFICGITTIAGFASLGVSSIVMIWQMGIAASLGTMIMLMMNLTTLPCVVFHFSKVEPLGRRMIRKNFIDRMVHSLYTFSIKHYIWVLLCLVPITILSVCGMLKTTSETDVIKFFKPGAPISEHFNTMSRLMHGAYYLDLVLESKKPDDFKDPVLLSRVDQLDNALAGFPDVGDVLSINDFLKWINRLIHDNQPKEEKIPESFEAVAQYLVLYQMIDREREIERFISEDGSTLRLSLRVRAMGSRSILELMHRVETACRMNLPPHLTYHVTGRAALFAKAADNVSRGMIRSFGLGIFLIFLLLIPFLGSAKIALLAIIPNVLPIFIVVGILGWLSYPIDIGISVLAPIVIGLTVDDTIRFLVCFQLEIDKNLNCEVWTPGREEVLRDLALEKMFENVSRPSLSGSLLVVLGFMCFLFSDLVPVARLGWLTATTIIICLLDNLIILPATLCLFKLRGFLNYEKLHSHASASPMEWTHSVYKVNKEIR